MPACFCSCRREVWENKPLAGAVFYNSKRVVNVAGKLTDRDKKQIIADRVEGMSFRKIAEKYNVSAKTIQNVVKADKDFLEKSTQKKEQNTLDMLAYMDGQKGKIQHLLANILEALDNPEKLARTNPRDLATAYGIIYDKIMASAPKENDEILNKAREVLGSAPSVIE